VDDLGLTDDQWHNLRLDYYFGNTEPLEGSVEAKAFRYLDAFHRKDAGRRARAEERNEACERYINRPFPGGPLTARLTSREAAELAVTLTRGHQAARREQRAAAWGSPEYSSYEDIAWEITEAATDVWSQTIISGRRQPGETLDEFRQRSRREPSRLPDTSHFTRLLQPSIDLPIVSPSARPLGPNPRQSRSRHSRADSPAKPSAAARPRARARRSTRVLLAFVAADASSRRS
jgi:hypothetical protein